MWRRRPAGRRPARAELPSTSAPGDAEAVDAREQRAQVEQAPEVGVALVEVDGQSRDGRDREPRVVGGEAGLHRAELQLELRRRIRRVARTRSSSPRALPCGSGRRLRRPQSPPPTGCAGSGRRRTTVAVTQPPITDAECGRPVSERVTCSVRRGVRRNRELGLIGGHVGRDPRRRRRRRARSRAHRDGLVGHVLQHQRQRRRERIAGREAEAEARRRADQRRRAGRDGIDRAGALRLDGIEHDAGRRSVVPVAVAVPTSAPRSWSTVQVGCASSSTAASPATCGRCRRGAGDGAVASACERARDRDSGRDEVGLERAAVAEARRGEARDRAVIRVGRGDRGRRT